jgi:putative alpha-1,2-mannosidase
MKLRSLSFSAVTIILALLVLVSAGLSGQPGKDKLVRYVDPFIGTGGHGHTYPGASVPFGMVQLSPDAGKSGWDWCSGYHYSDTGLVGFSHTHLSGTGCGDLGDILFMPTISSKNLDESYRAPFSHKQEYAEPGYYWVRLGDSHIKVELTSTARAGFHRYTFPVSDSSRVFVNLKYGQDDVPIETYMKVEGPTLVTGYRFSSGWANNQKVFFAARFSRPFSHAAMGTGGTVSEGTTDTKLEAKGKDVKGMFYFPTQKDSVLLVKVGISAVSVEGALKNLGAEIKDWNFDGVRKAASQVWEKELGRVRVASVRPELLRTYYTSLYHSMLAPTLYADIDGHYRGADGAVHQGSGFQNYCTFSLWDTYRAAHPLYTIVDPDRVGSMVQSMLVFAKQGGLLPVWPLAANETNTMVGYHAVPVIADAFLKGIKGFDPEEALTAMKKSAFQDGRGLRYYNLTPPALSSLVAEKRDGASQAAEFASAQVVSGYAKSISGETFGYHSSHPLAKVALISRAGTGKQAIAWETQAVPQQVTEPFVTFVWLAGVAQGKGAHRFELTVDGTLWFTFTTAKDISTKELKFSGKDGAVLSFKTDMVDDYGDFFGNMVMKLPASAVTPGKPATIRIVGEEASSPDWLMVFEYSLQPKVIVGNEFASVKEGGQAMQFVKVDVEHLGKPVEAVVSSEGAKPVRGQVVAGLNTFYLVVPAAIKETPLTVSVALDGQPAQQQSMVLKPVQPFGYIPADKEGESVSKTLEYAIDDYAIALMAKALGKQDDYELFMKRAANYKNLFDPSTGFMRGRNFDGGWVTPFNPRFSTGKQPEYTEGSAWQYTWLVPHDVAGLVELMGGIPHFSLMLDSLFNQSSDLTGTGAPPDVAGLIGLYAHGNEPSHHIAYMYDYVGTPWKTQELTRRIMDSFYRAEPDGLAGNEDCGQMSAWYVLSALGIYPVNPADGTYEIGSPIMDRAEIKVTGGKTFTITAKNVSAANKFIQSAKLNGQKLDRPWITHLDIMKGGKLEFVMGDKPNKAWGSTVTTAPPSMTWRGGTK